MKKTISGFNGLGVHLAPAARPVLEAVDPLPGGQPVIRYSYCNSVLVQLFVLEMYVLFWFSVNDCHVVLGEF